ncbi:multicopper oxidase domain-containing protein [Rhodopseudomonas sp. BAL398]|uniref:multicopper oxidase family protein n=1 Tax=Rhodopseudomonas sp. BAL398 TaxID=3034676 RepID=UPI0023E17226|nr:multicopper oxidase domain-containing protein [Rhodopseudomonas sp. BAL398]MDF3812667.1 multicopper oxidase domain-containing protein [Rhodopseudomonas sp. BAL398]
MTEFGATITRRGLLAGLGGLGIAGALPAGATAPGPQPLILQARPGSAALRAGAPESRIASLQRSEPLKLRFRRGDEIAVRFENHLAQPVLLNWHGVDGVASAEPLTARPAVPPGGRDEFTMPLRHAGTVMFDIRLLTDRTPLPAQALIVEESEAVAVDRAEVMVIEDWRVRADGAALVPGTAPGDAEPVYTINGEPRLDLATRPHQRIRLRWINGCQRNVIAIKLADHAVWVMAIDGQPSEPFLARNGTLVLAPGTRIDAFVDTPKVAGTSQIILHDGQRARPIARLIHAEGPALRTAPLPAATALPDNDLPARIDLKSALRVDMTLGAVQGWTRPAEFARTATPAFEARRGRAVVLALSNRGAIPAIFHLHGHHFRLLDRLDDGWKPFWLDTLAIDAGQAQRVAFVAEFAGSWLMETMAADWAAPLLLRSYAVI